MKLFLVRHGESQANKQNITQGQLDSNLTDLGIDQAKKLANRLKDYDFDIVYSSDLKRAVETAKEINKFHHKQIILDKRIREIDRGDFTGQPHSITKPLWDALPEDEFEKKAPNGETRIDQVKRVTNFIEEIEEQGKNILIVCHGHTIRCILKALFSDEKTLHEIWEEFPKPNACLYEIDVDKDRNINFIHKGCNIHLD